MAHPLRRRLLPTAVLVPLLLPFVAYFAAAVVAGSSAGAAATATIAQATGKPTLFAPVVLSIVPIGLLLLVDWLARRRDPDDRWRTLAAWSGLLPVLVLLAWVNWTAWPMYLPGKPRPGFPHGLELVIVPLIFAPVAAIAGWLVGMVAGRRG